VDDALVELERLVTFRLSLVAKMVEKRLAALVDDEYGLSVAEYRVLAQLGLHPGSTLRSVSARTLIDKAQVSRTIAVLEEQQLASRSVSDSDRRSPQFTLTAEGAELLGRIVPRRLAQEREVLADLGADAEEALSRALDTLMEHLGEPEVSPQARPSVKERRRRVRQRALGGR
jgi:DNA-binding MarR family transcriptional regulator